MPVVRKSWAGSATMQSTRSASTMRWRISPSPPEPVESEPLAMTKPATPPPRPFGGREVVDEVLDPGVVGVADRRRAVAPAHVVGQQLARPVRDVERRIGEDVVGLEVRVQVAQEAVGGLRAEVGLDAADGEVHVRQPPGGGVGLLAEDRDVGGLPAVGLDEAFRLHEHARRAAAGVVDAALVGFEHLDQQAHDAARREELAAELALGLGELAEEVLVDAAERVAGLGAVALEADVGDQVDQPLHLLRRDTAAGVVARQLALEVRVVALDGEDGVVDQRGDVGPRGLVLQVLPARLGRHPEHPLGGVLVAALQQAFELRAGDAVGFQLGLELLAAGLEGVGDVLQEQQAEDDVLVLGGVDLAAQGVGGFPEDLGVGEVGGVGFSGRHQDSVLVSVVAPYPADLLDAARAS